MNRDKETGEQFLPPKEEEVMAYSGLGSSSGPMRQFARGVIASEIHRLERRLHSLKVIEKYIPREPSSELDEALWDILIHRGMI